MARVSFLLTVVVNLCLAPAGAEETKVNAAVNLAGVDDDFWLQGEYMGTLASTQASCSAAGLQVVAKGSGQFESVYFKGGLPGSGWHDGGRSSLAGKCESSTLKMAGDGYKIIVDGQSAQVFQNNGSFLGCLGKVHRTSATLGRNAPCGAETLFDGSQTLAFKNGRITEDGLLDNGTELLRSYRDYTLHVEFRVPYMPQTRSQKRGNSGVYLQSRYEVQILDSFGLEGAYNECGALYRYRPPTLNMAFPPLSWQTYDITFRAACFSAVGQKIKNAQVTVRHNGIVVQDRLPLVRKTGAGKKESAQLLPIKFQDHNDPIQFRNIWIIDHRTKQGRLMVLSRFKGPRTIHSRQHRLLQLF